MASPRDQMLEARAEAEKYFFKWKSERDALQADHDAEEKREEYEFQKAKEDIEAEYHIQRQVIAASGPQSFAMMDDFLVEKRANRLKVMQHDFERRKKTRQDRFDKRMHEHSERFGDQIIRKMNVVAAYRGITQPDRLSNHMPLPAGQATTLPLYPHQPLGSNMDNRIPAADQVRQQPQARPNHDRDYNRHAAQQRPFGDETYPRYASQPRSFRHEYSAPATMERPPPRWVNALPSSNPSEVAAARQPLPGQHILPGQKHGHQIIMPSTAMTAEPERFVTAPSTAGSTKRKADLQGSPSDQGHSKRMRSVGPQGLGETDPSKSSTPRPTQRKPSVKRSIDFDEVYQDGHAEYKHIIIEHPAGEGNWYILKCDEHGVHFNRNPLHGAAKHLHSSQHSNMSKEHSLAVKELGHLVWDCNAELAAKNNAAVREAFDRGYKPFNRNQLTKTERRSMGFSGAETPPVRKIAAHHSRKGGPDGAPIGSDKQFSGVVYPVDAELYLGYWSKNKTKYAVMLLPRGDLNPTSIMGTLKDTGLLEKAPKCYTIDKETREITGWAEGYEDGGRLVTKREFPVMYFDGNLSVGWLRAKDLSIFDFEDPDWRSIPNYDEARNRYAAAQPRGFESYQHMKEYYRAHGLPPKLYSAVSQPYPTPEAPATPSGANDGDAGSRPDGRTSPQLHGGDDMQADGHGAVSDIDPQDASRVRDDTESLNGSEISDPPDSDDDVEMADAESRHTSVSNKNVAQEKAPSETDGDHAALLGAASNASSVADQPSASTAGMASPGGKQPGVIAGSNKDKGTASEIVQSTEDASVSLKEAADSILSGDGQAQRANGPIPPRESESGSRSSPSSAVSSPPAEDSDVPLTPAPAQTTTPSGGAGPDAARDVSKSPVPSTQGKAGTSSGEEPSSSRTGDDESAVDQQLMQGIQANEVVVATPAPTSKSPEPRSAASPPRVVSPMPAAVASSSSRKTTPTAVSPRQTPQSDRWKAVRSEPGPQAPASPKAQQPAAVLSVASPARSASKEPSKEASTLSAGTRTPPSGLTSTPLPGRAASNALSGEYFELAYYEDDMDGLFHKEENGPFLRVVVDKQANILETSPGQGVQAKIDPRNIVRVDVDPLDDSAGAPCMVSLVLKEQVGAPKEQKLVFETSKAMGREEAGRIHARRFCAWVKRVNGTIDYRNHTYNSNRPSTSYIRK